MLDSLQCISRLVHNNYMGTLSNLLFSIIISLYLLNISLIILLNIGLPKIVGDLILSMVGQDLMPTMPNFLFPQI